MQTYNLSKGVEILVSKTFKTSNIVKVSLLLNNMLTMIGYELQATSSGTVVRPILVDLIADIIAKRKGSEVSVGHLLKLANGISHREWVSKIMTFHVILAVCIIVQYVGKLLEEYTDVEIMFRPLIHQYGARDNVVSVALDRPIYTNKVKVNRVANALTIHNSVVLKGPSGTGKKTLILAMVKQIVLGNYPLLYNSVVLVNPTKSEVDMHAAEQIGTQVICVITSENTELVSTSRANMKGISLSRRIKFVYIVDSDRPDKFAAPTALIASERIDLEEPSIDETILILRSHVLELAEYVDFTTDRGILKYIAEAADRFEGATHRPTRAINLLTELIFDKLNRTILGERNVEIPTYLHDCAREECISIMEKLSSNTAFTMLKSASAHIHVSLRDAEKFVVRRFKLTKEILASMLSTNVREHLKDLKSKLMEKIFGQDEALDEIVKSLWRRALKLDAMVKPVSFMLIGFSGVGKTYTAKKLAELMYGSEDKMVRFDMSEYMERHEVSKLIGSPPGYIGSQQPGRLTDTVSKNPYSILLFDEVEKAHRDVMNIFLQILDDGRLTDNQGKTVDFSKTIIIMTSNIGCDIAYGSKSTIGFTLGQDDPTKRKKEIIRKETETHFKPEFINRIDKIMVMNVLRDADFEKIISTRLRELSQSSILDVKYGSRVVKTILKTAKTSKYDIQKYNARELKRVIVDEVENRIVEFMVRTSTKRISVRSTKDDVIIIESRETKDSDTIMEHMREAS